MSAPTGQPFCNLLQVALPKFFAERSKAELRKIQAHNPTPLAVRVTIKIYLLFCGKILQL